MIKRILLLFLSLVLCITTMGMALASEDDVTLTIGISGDSTLPSWTKAAVNDWIYERTKIKIEWKFYSTSGSEARTQLDLDFQSGAKMPDIILGIMNDAGRDAYGAAGFIRNLNDYFNSDAANYFYEACEREGFTKEEMMNYAKSPDGGLYGVPSFSYAVNNYYSNRAWVNSEFLKALNMKSPTTADELYDFLVAAKTKDPNQNGMADEIGIIGSTNGWNGNPLRWLQNMFIYCDNTDDGWIVTPDGELDVAYDKPEYQKFLIYARKLCDEGLLDPLSFTQDYDTYLGQITADTLTVAIGVSGGIGGFKDNVKSYEAAQVVEGPDGLKVATYAAPYANTAAYITKDCADPDAAFKLLMIGFSDAEYGILSRYGVEGLDWEYCKDNEVSLYEALGYKAKFKWLRGDIRSIEGQTSVWGSSSVLTLPRITSAEMEYYLNPEDPANLSTVKTAGTTIAQLPFQPEKYVVKIIYTADEDALIAEQRATLRTFVKEAAARFVAGDLNPESDWDAYISELETIGYKNFLDVSRTAYHRTIGE